MATIPPLLQSFLTLIFFPTSSPSLFTSLPLIHSPHPLPLLAISTLTQAITYVILSPLDLIRTRMIVQSAQVAHRKYSTPWSALSTIIAEEGGLQTTYFHSSLLIPTILEGVIRPFIYMSIPLIISRWLLLEPSSSPLFFLLAEFVLNSAGLLITIPIETVRKRLQIQSRAAFVRGGRVGGTGRAWRTCVETRPQPYLGVVECVYRILTEETGNIPRRRRRSAVEREGSTKGKGKAEKEDLGTAGLGVGNGLRQLYRGLGMGVGANLCVFLLTLLGGGESSVGWAEV
jgi:fusion and transport protein UGO1